MKPECWTGHTLDHQVLSMTPLQTFQNEDLSQQRTVKFLVKKNNKAQIIRNYVPNGAWTYLCGSWTFDETGIYGLHWIKQQVEAVRIHWMSIHRQRKKRTSRPGLGWGETTYGSSCQTSRSSWVSWIFMGFLSIEHRSIKHRSTSQDQKLSIKDRGQLHMGIYPQAI